MRRMNGCVTQQVKTWVFSKPERLVRLPKLWVSLFLRCFSA